jgi:homoserine O-succinyltransferase
MHPFTLPEIERGPKSRAHIEKYYEPFEKIQQDGLDALIISGANVTQPDLTKAPFWEPLQKVMAWSWDHTTSTLCSCLATHAVMQFRYAQARSPLKRKLWGVYNHRVVDRHHPMMRGVNTIFDVPHSRHNQITATQFENAGMNILSESAQGGVHVAVSPDGLRLVCFQGHPEYDTISLYKEYKREAMRYKNGEISRPPRFPQNYLSVEAHKILKRTQSRKNEWPIEDQDMCELIENSWGDSARSMIGNWTGLVYQLTHLDRRKPFMDGVNPDNPLASL